VINFGLFQADTPCFARKLITFVSEGAVGRWNAHSIF